MYNTNVETAVLTEPKEKDVDSKFTRFKDADWFDELCGKPVIVGGVGGIGSWVSLLLSRIGCSLHLFDFDKIDSLNMAGQIFRKSDIGKLKTEAMRDYIKDFSDNYVYTYGKYTKKSYSSSIVFSCFDNMKARKIMFENWVKFYSSYENAIFIDGRLLMEAWQIFCVTKDRIKKYREFLFDDSEVEDLACTMKQTSHCAAMIASHMVGFLTNHFSEKRPVPFFYEYVLPANFTNLNP